MDRLHAMRVFLRVAERASFTQAAKSLELSRARVSEAIAELERELGVLLLHRTTRQVSLTDDGRLYYDRARQILADVEEADALVQRGSAQARGRLRLAMPMAIARRFVVPALPGLLAKHPELGLEIRLENRAVDLLEEGIDAAISYGAPADQDLVARRLGETHLLTCASPTYLARRGTPRTPHDIEYHECIAFLTLATLRPAEWAFVIKDERVSVRPAGSLAFNSMQACLDAAEAGLGITQVLSSLAHHAVHAKRVRPVLTRYAAAGPPLFLVYPPNRQHSARMRVLIDFFSELFTKS